jgi:hypothetical protein
MHAPRSAIVVLFALMSLVLAACGNGENLPFVGDWAIDVTASINANSGNAKKAKIIRRIAGMRFNIQNDEWTRTWGETSETESHDLVAASGKQFKLEGEKGGAMVLTMLGKDRMAMRDENEITVILVRAKS